MHSWASVSGVHASVASVASPPASSDALDEEIIRVEEPELELEDEWRLELAEVEEAVVDGAHEHSLKPEPSSLHPCSPMAPPAQVQALVKSGMQVVEDDEALEQWTSASPATKPADQTHAVTRCSMRSPRRSEVDGPSREPTPATGR
jgi:hypothetical protein